ncbi:hypothetical protein [Pantoea agglomerans]|uniref:Uncharacterized protein n=1 Tax=Enterobacter agglomerans TaxID=549 RepID=A0ACC5PXJ5_ENTAG|nr:hypothetical protein [Pantoea agglomerans]MBD8129253.1 hypothetical protein [Pantoea agglomerans]MBD8155043.1 hypothetical protein [Pantoea agglomerans]
MSIEWNGNGLPPVGCECELVNFYGNDFPEFVGEHGEQVKIIGSGFTNGCPVAFYEADGGRGGMLAYAVEQCFRPIRTEAERKREEAEVAMRLCLKGTGYGMTEGAAKTVFDAIAAGKIPHITLK